MIANWLYLHGVSYQYERDYKVLTADAFHRQYKPDFYYPDIDAWHEHWALDQRGNPPPNFDGYLEDMEFKRRLHATNKTDLIETTFGEVVFDNGLAKLEGSLLSRGIEMNWDPDRTKAEYTNIEHSETIQLVRTFMTHIKSNSLSAADIENRLNGKWNYLRSYRTTLFLDLYWMIHYEWNRRLGAANAIDFEDMLIQAANVVENRKHIPDYDLILVDEFQDSSTARARLVKSLLKLKGKYILAVGDDWQSINRFAGADVSLMSHFHESFGNGPTLHLSRTYRSSQTIADVATKFVTKNPKQIKKNVEADQGGQGNPIVLIRAKAEHQGVREALQRISEEVNANGLKNASVYILGRYKFNRDWVPNDEFPKLQITYRTVHGSKGLEADYVVLVNLEFGRHGFPSEIEDDPLLNLAMSELETYEHAEERRLLYVALTRARKQAFLVTRQNRESMFAVELMLESLVDVVTLDSDDSENLLVETCTKCKKGLMITKTGPYSKFLACSRFPKCDHKTKLGLF
jgi:DNA helicase-4